MKSSQIRRKLSLLLAVLLFVSAFSLFSARSYAEGETDLIVVPDVIGMPMDKAAETIDGVELVAGTRWIWLRITRT